MKNFKSVSVIGKNIDEVWFELLTKIPTNGRVYRIDSGSNAGDFRLEFDEVHGTILKPIEYDEFGNRKPLAVTVPMGCPAPTSESSIENYFTYYIMDSRLKKYCIPCKFETLEEDLFECPECHKKLILKEHYKYATFIRGGRYYIPQIEVGSNTLSHKNVKLGYKLDTYVQVPDQFQWCIDHYERVGFGNNHCEITVGYPESSLAYDIPYTSEIDRHTSPCLRRIGTKIKKSEDKYYLCWDLTFRSWDLYAGMPENLGGLAIAQELMATMLNVEVGTMSFSSSGLHCYGYQISSLVMRSGNKKFEEEYNKMITAL